MAERRSGPVKPPTIDLKAREAEPRAAEMSRSSSRGAGPAKKAKPVRTAAKTKPIRKAPAGEGSGPANAKSAPQNPSGKEKAKERPGEPPVEKVPGRGRGAGLALGAGVAGGAVAGALAAWLIGLAANPVIDMPEADPRIGVLETEIVQLAEASKILAGQTAGNQSAMAAEFEAIGVRLGAAEAETADLKGAIAALPTKVPAAPEIDLGPYDAQLAALGAGIETLAARFDALAAGASAEDAAMLAGDIVAARKVLETFGGRLDLVESNLAGLAGQSGVRAAAFAAISERMSVAETELVAVRTGQSALAGAEAGALEPPSSSPRLPLALAGLDAALRDGRPFARELEIISGALPGLLAPEVLSGAAAEGLGRPDRLAARFGGAVPALLAAMPRREGGGWAEAALDRLKALIALRPVEDGGDSPDALVGRIEVALGNGDVALAAELFGRLPAPMRDAGGDLGSVLDGHAAAGAFLTAARDMALTATGEGTR